MPVKRFMEIARDWLGRRTVVHVAPGVRAKFLLKYGTLIIGTLSVQDSVWQFDYSEEFKQDGQLRPLVEFPELDRSYKSADLWQFFAMRIPSAEQPEVEEILRREKILEDDAVGLLKRFGGRTIANPFELTLAA
jgi:HipA-like protein